MSWPALPIQMLQPLTYLLSVHMQFFGVGGFFRYQALYIFSDPYQDYFEKEGEERKEKVAKNEYQRLRNISRGQKGRIRGCTQTMLELEYKW